MATLRLALGAWLRYVAPLTAIAAVLLAPVWIFALQLAPAGDLPAARAQLRLTWALAATVWIAQLALVAAAAPAIRGLASGARLSQWRALVDGLRGLVRALAPTLVVVAAVALGAVALVVPGIVLLGALAMTGASERLRDALPAPLVDSVTAARAKPLVAALVIAAVLGIDLALAGGAELGVVHHLRAVTPASLAEVRRFVQIFVAGLVVVSPGAACLLAATYLQLTPNSSSAART